MSDKIDLGWFYHLLGGWGIESASILVPLLLIGVAVKVVIGIAAGVLLFLLVGGIIREWWQSEWNWFGWRWHKWKEALGWPLGGLLALPWFAL